jgi:hypothetical protein
MLSRVRTLLGRKEESSVLDILVDEKVSLRQ